MQLVTQSKTVSFSKASNRIASNCRIVSRLGGLRPGPALLVATGPGLFDPLGQRLSALPSLPWMRGSLTLVSLWDACDTLPDRDFDDVLTLLQVDSHPDTVSAAYWTVLRKATVLGMIEGRGVPVSSIA